MTNESEYALRKKLKTLQIEYNNLEDKFHLYKNSISELYEQIISQTANGNLEVHVASMLRLMKRLLR